MKVWKEDRVIGAITTDDIRRAIEREGIVIPKGVGLYLYVSINGQHGGVERVHIDNGICFEWSRNAPSEQG